MRKIGLVCLVSISLFTSCQQQDPLSSICKGGTAESYSSTFKVWCPSQGSDYFVPVHYGCPPEGEGISPPIAWSGIPKGSTHLRVMVIDATCTYECNSCCKYHHWILDIPISEMMANGVVTPDGIAEGAAKDPRIQKYVLPNTSNKKAYMPFCPPVIQTHAYVYQLIAYKNEGGKMTIMGRSQGIPLLYSLNPPQ